MRGARIPEPGGRGTAGAARARPPIRRPGRVPACAGPAQAQPPSKVCPVHSHLMAVGPGLVLWRSLTSWDPADSAAAASACASVRSPAPTSPAVHTHLLTTPPHLPHHTGQHSVVYALIRLCDDALMLLCSYALMCLCVYALVHLCANALMRICVDVFRGTRVCCRRRVGVAEIVA